MTAGGVSGRPGRREPSAESRRGGQWPVTERSLLPTVLGVPPQAGVGIAFGFTALGVFVDILRIGTVGAVFQIAYFTGCVLSVAWVRWRSLFAPMVAPPLLLAVVVPSVVLLSSEVRPGAGIAEELLLVGAPMVNAFPAMAWTTAVVLAVGIGRIVTQRPLRDTRGSGSGRRPPQVRSERDSAAAPSATRRPTSPRRS